MMSLFYRQPRHIGAGGASSSRGVHGPGVLQNRKLRGWLFGLSVLVAFFQAGGAGQAAANQAGRDEKAELKAPGVKRDSLPSALRKPSPGSVGDLRAMEKHLRDLIARVSPAVVAVRVRNATGSGVVISQTGYVLCAAHVCESPNRDVVFTFPDGSTARGKTLGTNHEDDAGLMKITDSGKWPFASVGDFKQVGVGDWVVALGHPSGFDPQRSRVARLGRLIAMDQEMVQSDCTLVGGDSGGPLFDMHGRVVAIHSRISNAMSANFHVSIASFMEDWERLLKGDNWGDERPPARPYVGARGTAQTDGYRLDRVDANSPASKAGLRAGDVVVQLNGAPLNGDGAVTDFVSKAKPNDSVSVKILRDNEELELKMTVGARPGRP